MIGSALTHRVQRLEHWLACCLARGELAPVELADATELADLLTEQHLEAGAPIFHQGDRLDRIGIVRRGEVGLYQRVGSRNLLINVLSPGDVLGDIPVLSENPMLYTARMLSNGSILMLKETDLRILLRSRPHIASRWLISVAGRMERTQRRLLEVLSGGLEAKLSLLLIDQAKGGKVKLSQESLAQLLGAKRESVNRALRHLAQEGLVETSYGSILILDPRELASRSTLGDGALDLDL